DDGLEERRERAAGREGRADVEGPAEGERLPAGRHDTQRIRWRERRERAGDNARLLQILDGIGEYARRDDDEEAARPGEEGGQVQAHGAASEEPAHYGGDQQADDRARERERGAAERLHH